MNSEYTDWDDEFNYSKPYDEDEEDDLDPNDWNKIEECNE